MFLLKRGASGFLYFLAFIFINSPAYASLLRFLSPAGTHADTSFPSNFSENDFEIQRPALLVPEEKRKFIHSFEYEDIYRSERNGVVVHSMDSYKNKMAFVYPQKLPAFRFVFGADTYISKQHVFTNDEIRSTNLVFKGSGGAFGIAVSDGSLSLGYFGSNTASRGEGTSLEVTDQISVLSSDAKINLSSGAQKEGFQVGLKGKRGSLYYQENQYRVPLHLKLTDKEDRFSLPVVHKGLSREYLLLSDLSHLTFLCFYQKGSGRSHDTFYYNESTTLGAHLSDSRFRFLGLGVRKGGVVFAWEKYKGATKGASAIDIIGSFFGLVGGYYLVHYNSELDFNKYKVSYKTKLKELSMNVNYHLTRFNLNAHFDAVQKLFFGFVEENRRAEDLHLRGDLHMVSLSIKKHITKNFLVGYSFTQHIPETRKVEEVVEPEVREVRKVRGGSLHIFSLQYDF